MLKLFEPRWLAYKIGKWRSLAYFMAVAAPLSMIYIIGTVFASLPHASQPPEILRWFQIILGGVAALLSFYGCYYLYRDHEHHAYIDDADHYQRNGW